tara:strand:+ start:39701 stop:39853 length:153 start_codon:yes stop_codon:yes gene_type:complete
MEKPLNSASVTVFATHAAFSFTDPRSAPAESNSASPAAPDRRDETHHPEE